MTDSRPDLEGAPKKRGKIVVFLSLALAIGGAGGGYYGMTSGLIPGLGSPAAESGHSDSGAVIARDARGAKVQEDVVFLPVEPIMISLSGNANQEHLRFRAELEVVASQAENVAHLMPRIIDLLNGYLRALEVADLLDPGALTRLRAQMLRRINVVAGPGRVRDLLIMEFVLN